MEAIQLSAEAGIPLYPWQEIALEAMLGVQADGTWAAQEFGLICARQNGKSQLLEARELAGLFLFGEQRIVHSAHQSATADEAFKRMRNLIESVPWLDSEVAKILGSPGRQSIRTRSGSEISYRTRTKGGARGFSAPTVIFDEAQELSGEQYAAIVPVTSAFRNRQIVLTGTVLAGAAVLQGVVDRGRRGAGTDLGYAEWSAAEDCRSDDPVAIRQANPSIGHREGLTVEYFFNDLERFRSAQAEDKYREERLSIWPDAGTVGQMVSAEAWGACRSDWRPGEGQAVEFIGVASSVDGAWSAVGIAFAHGERTFVDLARYEPGTDWVIPYVQGLAQRRRPKAVVMDKGGPASKSLANGLTAMLPKGVLQETGNAMEMQAATAVFIDAVPVGRVEHIGRPALDASVVGVREKIVGDARMYDRRRSPVVVAPVEAVTLAAWGLLKAKRPSRYDSGDLLVLGG